MMLLNQSVIQDVFISNGINIFIVTVLLGNCIVKKQYKNIYILGMIGVLLLSCIILRYTIGGVGIGIWLTWTKLILITYTAIQIDKTNFYERLVKLVTFMAIISLLFWLISLVNISIVQKMMLFSYHMKTNFMRVYTDSQKFYTIPYLAYGGLAYVVNMAHPTRNCGIFTEPGIYQIVLNTALFICLYVKINLSQTKIKRIIFFLVCTIISTQSTGGFISLIIVFFPIIMIKGKGKLKKQIICGIVTLLVVLIVQYYIKGNQSILYITVIKKVFTNDNTFSLIATTGAARMGTVLVCMQSMLAHPFGIGYDNLIQILNADITGYVAASIFQTGAACGIIVALYILFKIFYPIIKTKQLSNLAKVSFILIYINNLFSQSVEFYPFLLCIPIGVMVISQNKKNNIQEVI